MENQNMSLSGLRHLANLEQFVIIPRVFSSPQYDTQYDTQYDIENYRGELLYRAFEEYDFWNRCCSSETNIIISDTQGLQVMRLHRMKVCCNGCFNLYCSQDILQVYAPSNNFIGTVEKLNQWFSDKFDIKNAIGDVVLKIKCPTTFGGFCNIHDFQILSHDKSAKIGRMARITAYSGWGQGPKPFIISFPSDLDIQKKALLVGASFLLILRNFGATTWAQGPAYV